MGLSDLGYNLQFKVTIFKVNISIMIVVPFL